jgi:hypothetical protein
VRTGGAGTGSSLTGFTSATGGAGIGSGLRSTPLCPAFERMTLMLDGDRACWIAVEIDALHGTHDHGAELITAIGKLSNASAQPSARVRTE